MASSWNVKTELVNEDTQLRKVNATCIENGNSQTYFVKARMATDEEKKNVWDDIWNQHLRRTETVIDAVAEQGKSNLDARVKEVP